MSTKLRILVLLALSCFLGCQKKVIKDSTPLKEQLSNLIKKTEENSIQPKERLGFAKQADSVAILLHDQSEHLFCQRIIGTLYLKLGNSNLAKAYFLRTEELAKNLSDFETQGVSLNNLGIIYNERSCYDSALKYYGEANQIFRNKGYRLRLAQGLVNMGVVYKNQGYFEDAFKISLDAAKLLDSLNAKKDLASAYTTLGNILKDLNRLDDALQYHQLALQLRNSEHDSAGIAGSLHNIGNIYRIKKEYPKALENYQNALKIKEMLGLLKTTGTTVDNIGEVYFDMKEYGKAEEYFKKALEIREANQDQDGILTTSNKLTKLYLAKNEVENAKTMALRTLSIVPRSGFLQQRLDNALMLTQIYQTLKQYEPAIIYANLGLALKDSLFNMEIANTVSQLNVKYKTEQKEKELILSKQLQGAQANQIHSQQSFIILLIIFILSLSCLSILLYRSNKLIKQANQKIETLMHELNHRVKNNLQIVSDMLHLQLSITNEESQMTLIQSSINRVESMNIIHTLLYKEGYNGTIGMGNFIETLIASLEQTYQDKSGAFDISVNIQNSSLDIDKAIPIGLIINELTTNIFKYSKASKENPFFKIKLTQENKNCKLEIMDNCEYWNIQAIRTKKNGLGLFLVETLVKQLKGNWTSINNEKGTTHIIEFSK